MRRITRRKLLTALPVAAVGGAIAGSIADPLLNHLRGHATKPREIINFFNIAKEPLGIKPDTLLKVMGTYVERYLGPVWGVTAELHWSKKAQPGVWNCAFVDSDENDAANAIAYHNLDATDNGGIPYALVDVGAAHRAQKIGGLGVAVTHELAEMLANPGINNWAAPTFDATDPNLLALEIADPVERTHFEIDGVPVSNFVYPAYFESWREHGQQFDYLGVLNRPREIAPGGYQIVRCHETLSEVVNSGDTDIDVDRCWRVRQLRRRFSGAL